MCLVLDYVELMELGDDVFSFGLIGMFGTVGIWEILEFSELLDFWEFLELEDGVFSCGNLGNCEMVLGSVECVLLKYNLKAQGSSTIFRTTPNPLVFGIFGMWICEILLCALESGFFKEA